MTIAESDRSQTFAVKTGDGPTADFGGAELAGRMIQGAGSGELVTLGMNAMLVRLTLEAGFDQDGHSHPEHESIGYILSGQVEMTVGDDTLQLGPGATWYHPRDTFHTCKVLEEAEILEFHTPLRSDVLDLFELA